ncbi:3'-5' exonuclease [Clostridium sediminicola]|uniref:3'-5' exonuclease n=1 Tax=Clostridium sediminicola TaxID=3114879 RepID=UPI0031F25387
MKSIFIDTETTGLRPGKIVQLTYIIEENKTFKEAKNFFFMIEDGEMEPGAEKVHGFSVDKLAILSNGRLFEDSISEIKNDLINSIFIAHNSKFDKKFIDAEFGRLNLETEIAKEFCTMKYFKNIVQIPGRNGVDFKNPKLSEVVKHYNLDPDDILRRTKILFNADKVSFHDARFDTAAMYMCCLLSQNRPINLGEENSEQIDLF